MLKRNTGRKSPKPHISIKLRKYREKHIYVILIAIAPTGTGRWSSTEVRRSENKPCGDKKNSKDGPLTELGRKRGCLLTEETEEPQVVQWKEKAIGTLWASMWWGGRFCKQGFQSDVRFRGSFFLSDKMSSSRSFSLTDRAPEGLSGFEGFRIQTGSRKSQRCCESH